MSIFVKILLFAQSDYQPIPRGTGHCSGRDACLGWVRYRHVCLPWKDIVDNTPQLWTHISTRCRDEWIALSIQKSAQEPLSISLYAHSDREIRILNRISNRISGIVIHDIDQPLLDRVLNVHIPNLQSVEFRRPLSTPRKITARWAKDAFADDSTLHRLDLTYASMPHEVLSRFQHLKTLRLRSQAGRGPDFHWGYLFKTLPLLSGLKSLELEASDIVLTGIDEPPVELLSIRLCRIMAPATVMLDFLERFKMPYLLDLDLAVANQWPWTKDQQLQFYEDIGLHIAQHTESEGMITGLEISVGEGGLAGATYMTAYVSATSIRFKLTAPMPLYLPLKSVTECLDSLGYSNIRTQLNHLILKSGCMDGGSLILDESGWVDLLRYTKKISRLTLHGYGDRWAILPHFLCKPNASCLQDLLWPELKEISLKAGFWVKPGVALDWLEALERRKALVPVELLSIEKWEMQASERYRDRFIDAVKAVVGEIKRPGLTEEPACPHGWSSYGDPPYGEIVVTFIRYTDIDGALGYYIPNQCWWNRQISFGLAWDGAPKAP